MNKNEIYTFDEDEIKEIKKALKVKDTKKALELWAYQEFDLKHNCSIYLGEVTNNSVEICRQD